MSKKKTLITTENTPIQSFPVKYCPPCVIALHHFVDYTGQAFHRVNFLTGQAESTEKVVKDSFTGKIIGCAIEVHRALGPGLLESTYQQCLDRELAINNIKFSLEKPLPVEYKGVHLDCGYRIDILIESEDVPCRLLIVELKSVEEIKEIHRAQLLTYMKLSKIKTGLLINFNVKRLKDGIERFKL